MIYCQAEPQQNIKPWMCVNENRENSLLLWGETEKMKLFFFV